MPRNPIGSCALCKTVKENISKFGVLLNLKTKKHILIYGFFYLLIFELFSFILAKDSVNIMGISFDFPNYAFYTFPLLTQMGYSLMFISLWHWRFKLSFCQRKKIAVFSLFLYYSFNAICIMFQLCESFFTKVITYGLLSVVFVTLLLTIYQPKK